MTNHDDRLFERDLREALAGDGPDPALQGRILARVQAESARGARGPATPSSAMPPPAIAGTGRRSRGRVITMASRRRHGIRDLAVAVAVLLVLGGVVWLATTLFSGLKVDPGVTANGDREPDGANVEITDINNNAAVPNIDRVNVNGSTDWNGNTVERANNALPGANDATNQPSNVIERPDNNAANLANNGASNADSNGAPTPNHADNGAMVETPNNTTNTAPTPNDNNTNTPLPTPRERLVVATVAAGALKMRETADDRWAALEDNAIRDGWSLQASRPVELTLPDGAQLRFEGELAFSLAADDAPATDTIITLLKRGTECYLDNLGATERTLRDDEHVSLTTSSAAWFKQVVGGLEIACFEGVVETRHGAVDHGEFARLGDDKLANRRDLRDSDRTPSLLRDLPPRVLLRHDFDATPFELQVGAVADGIVRSEGREHSIVLSADATVLPGATIRIRFRVYDARALYIQIVRTAGREQYGLWRPIDAADLARGDWLVWEIPLAELLRDDGSGREALAPGTPINSIKLFAQDGQSPVLELDSLELLRRPE